MWGRLENDVLDPAMIDELQQTPDLGGVKLVNVQASAEDFEPLRSVTTLKSVTLENVTCPGLTLDWLKESVDLHTLKLGSSAWGDDAIGTQLGHWKKLREVDLSHTSIGDATLESLAKLDDLERLDLSGCTKVTPAAVAQLAEAVDFKQLTLNGVPMSSVEYRNIHSKLTGRVTQSVEAITDRSPTWSELRLEPPAEIWLKDELFLRTDRLDAATMRSLYPFVGVRTIRLVEATLEPGVLEELTHWPQLEVLEINEVKVPEDAATAFPKLPHLKQLNLVDTNLDASLFDQPERFGTLQVLKLLTMEVDPEWTKNLPAITTLQTLHISSVSIDDELIEAVSRIESLRSLHLTGPFTADDPRWGKEKEDVHYFPAEMGLDLTPLAQLPHLFTLTLERTTATDANVLKLQAVTSLRRLNVEQSPHLTDEGLRALFDTRDDILINKNP